MNKFWTSRAAGLFILCALQQYLLSDGATMNQIKNRSASKIIVGEVESVALNAELHERRILEGDEAGVGGSIELPLLPFDVTFEGENIQSEDVVLVVEEFLSQKLSFIYPSLAAAVLDRADESGGKEQSVDPARAGTS